MKKLTRLMLCASLCTSMLLTACGQNESSADSQAATAAGEVSSQADERSSQEESQPDKEEKTYMQRCGELLEEKQTDEIIKKRDGVEYPRFEKHTYYSNTAGRDTNVNVLLPAGYSEQKQYPVLYILHGYWDNEDWMARDVVHISTMLTNLVADGKAKEMIVVCPYIFCSKDLAYCTGMDYENTLAYDNFINDMMTDLMPYIEENFSVAKGRENTAITGFSMGAREALYIGFTYPDKFGYIGSVCTAPGVVNGTGSPYNLEKDQFTFEEGSEPYLLLLSAAKNDGVVGGTPATYHNMLEGSSTEHLWHEISGTGHDASSVTPHLYNLFRMVFMDN